MQCNTNYTGSLDNFKYINLNVLKTYATLFPETILGLSDHTPGHETVLGATALGSKVVEKHFTDDTSRPGPDHPFSMNPKTWVKMVGETRKLEKSLGDGIKKIEHNERESSIIQRRGIRANRKLYKGTIIKENVLSYLRPCPKNALNPYEKNKILGKKLIRNLVEGEIINCKNTK